MICVKCKEKKHDECKSPASCTCQHRERTSRTLPVYSERVAEAIRLRSVPAIVLNADTPPIDC
jgi:hypothetical protein